MNEPQLLGPIFRPSSSSKVIRGLWCLVWFGSMDALCYEWSFTHVHPDVLLFMLSKGQRRWICGLKVEASFTSMRIERRNSTFYCLKIKTIMMCIFYGVEWQSVAISSTISEPSNKNVARCHSHVMKLCALFCGQSHIHHLGWWLHPDFTVYLGPVISWAFTASDCLNILYGKLKAVGTNEQTLWRNGDLFRLIIFGFKRKQKQKSNS